MIKGAYVRHRFDKKIVYYEILSVEEREGIVLLQQVGTSRVMQALLRNLKHWSAA